MSETAFRKRDNFTMIVYLWIDRIAAQIKVYGEVNNE